MTTAPSRARPLARSIGQNSRARTSAAHAGNVILTAVGPTNSTWGESAESGVRPGSSARGARAHPRPLTLAAVLDVHGPGRACALGARARAKGDEERGAWVVGRHEDCHVVPRNGRERVRRLEGEVPEVRDPACKAQEL